MHSWKILLADDDPDDREMIRDALDSLGHEKLICFTQNGQEVLELLEKQSDVNDALCLIVLDLNMPKLNGTETLRRLKSDSRFKNTPVIIFSTSINSLEREKCMLLGAHSYITKPISYDECIQTAKTFLKFCHPTAATT